MDYIGTWVFHSIAAMNDDESGFVYLVPRTTSNRLCPMWTKQMKMP